MSDKIRFQNLKFQNKLKNASGYRRPIKKIPENPWEIFLARMGLIDWKIRVLVALIVFGAVYLVYAPTFLTIRHVSVQGLSADKAGILEQRITDELQAGKIQAQHNLIFASKKNMTKVISSDFDVLSVNSIQKKFPGRVIISVEPRMDKFMVSTPSRVYVVTNDGLTAMQIPLETASSTAPGLMKLTLLEDRDYKRGDRMFDQSKLDYFLELSRQTSKATGKPLENITVSNTNPQEGVLEIGGFKAYISLAEKVEKNSDNLSLLLRNVEAGKALFYIDMRYGEKAYVCYQGTPCAQEIPVQPISSTSTTTLMQLPNGQQ